jgi:hypothetical protein
LLGAAALVFAAVWLPYWGFRMSAPQYPDETLHLQVTRTGITGDVQEVQTLQQYIGVRFPEEIRELAWLPTAMIALAALIAASAFGGPGLVGACVRWLSVAAAAALLAISAAIVQQRLYDVGHQRDPHAPITAVKDFTPRLIGPTKIGNFTVWSFPHVGGVALAAGAALALAGATKGARQS